MADTLSKLICSKTISKSFVFAVNKPRGVSSTKVVTQIKEKLKKELKKSNKELKVGHGGTLDNLAEGILVIGINEGCKEMKNILTSEKIYEVTGCLGFETDTLDYSGKIIETGPIDNINREFLQSQLHLFEGKFFQEAPLYSSLKVNGKISSERVRNGEIIEPKTREVFIYSIKVKDFSEQIDKSSDLIDLLVRSKLESNEELKKNKKFVIEVHCKSGTYMRSLIRDIAKSLGSRGTAQKIVRIKNGPFCLDSGKILELEDVNLDNILKVL